MSLTPNSRAPFAPSSALAGLVMIGVAVSLYALTLQTSLEIPRALFSDGLSRQIVSLLGGRFESGLPGAAPSARVPYGAIWLMLAGLSLVAWFAGAGWIARRRRVPISAALGLWGFYGWFGWFPAGLWVIAQIAAETLGWTALGQFLTASCQLWNASLIAAWVAAFFALSRRADAPPVASPSSLRVPWGVWVGIAVYAVCFGVMNTQMYRALLVPHGDSAMYEEHLWNLLHGKGFRSYLDQGLFLGEHIQAVHLGLTPLYILWPSEILMEWCQSIALALGAIPVYRMAARSCGSRSAGIGLALAYLLYFPMQRLDISIDFKTFRPEAFGIPLFLCALDALEARRWGWMLGWLAATLTVKEDYGLMIAALGVWILCDAWWNAPATDRRRQRWLGAGLGAGLAVFGAVYVLLAVKVLIPYFRAGHPVHYTKYFGKFGNSASEIALNLLSHPALAAQELLSPENVLFAVALLAPLGFLPLLAPGRLAVGLPLFGLLCLNEIARNPQHHFHGPLVPVLFWAAAAGLARLPTLWNALRQRRGRVPYDAGGVPRFGCAWALMSAAAAGIFLSASPLGIEFWDPSSGAYWAKKYVPGKRARYAAVVVNEIPRDSRVASTDFIHTRFTHYARSYDFSSYRPDVPDDADYLVIDVHAPYSTIHSPGDVAEYREHPDRWELLPDRTDGYFYVFKRRR